MKILKKVLIKMLVTVLDGCSKNFYEKFVLNILKLLIDRIPTCLYFLKKFFYDFLKKFLNALLRFYLEITHEGISGKLIDEIRQKKFEMKFLFFFRIYGDILWKLSVKIARRFLG